MVDDALNPGIATSPWNIVSAIYSSGLVVLLGRNFSLYATSRYRYLIYKD